MHRCNNGYDGKGTEDDSRTAGSGNGSSADEHFGIHSYRTEERTDFKQSKEAQEGPLDPNGTNKYMLSRAVFCLFWVPTYLKRK